MKQSNQIPSTQKTVLKERYDLRILRSLRRIIRAVDLHSRQLSIKHNITAPQLICLLTIVEHKTIAVAALAKEIHLSASTVVGILDRLEDKRLIVRERDKADRRVVKIAPTQKGVEYVENAPSPLQARLADSLLKLNELEQVAISLALDRIVEMMEAEDIDAAPMLDTGQFSKKETL